MDRAAHATESLWTESRIHVKPFVEKLAQRQRGSQEDLRTSNT